MAIKPLTCTEDVKKVIEKIRDVASSDYELAHALEDQLYEAVLKEIATNGHPEAAAIAKLALTTKKIKFIRVTVESEGRKK